VKQLSVSGSIGPASLDLEIRTLFVGHKSIPDMTVLRDWRLLNETVLSGRGHKGQRPHLRPISNPTQVSLSDLTLCVSTL